MKKIFMVIPLFSVICLLQSDGLTIDGSPTGETEQLLTSAGITTYSSGNSHVTLDTPTTANSSISPWGWIGWGRRMIEIWWKKAVEEGCIKKIPIGGMVITEVDCNCIERVFGKNHYMWKWLCSWTGSGIPPIK